MESNGYIPINTSGQSVNSSGMSLLSPYPQRPLYVQPWSGQVMYSGNGSQAASTRTHNPLHFLYSGFSTPPTQHHPPQHVYGHSQSMNSHSLGPSPISHANVGMPFMGSTGYLQPGSQFMAGAAPSAMSRDSSSTHTGRQSGTVGAESFNSIPFGGSNAFSDDIRWPAWMGNAQVPSNSNTPPTAVNADANTPMKDALRSSAVVAVPGETPGNRGDLWKDSKRTHQRKLQRLAKNEFKEKSGEYPIKVPCSASGEIEEGYRVFVHRIFRATARRFLKIEVISFSDHPPQDQKTVMELIRKRFDFNPPLADGVIHDYLQKCMSACRYQWKKFWQKTGKGKKHDQCPSESFPALVKYWNTVESEEESRVLERERNEERTDHRLQILLGDTSQSLSADTTDPLLDEDNPESLMWKDLDLRLESETFSGPQRYKGDDDHQVQVGTSSTPQPHDGLLSANQRDEGNLGSGSPLHRRSRLRESVELGNGQGITGHAQESTIASLRTILDWRGEVDKKLTNTATEMSSMNKKIDFLIESLLSKEKSNTQFNGHTSTQTTVPQQRPTTNAHTDATPEKACSASAVSQEIGSVVHVHDEAGDAWVSEMNRSPQILAQSESKEKPAGSFRFGLKDVGKQCDRSDEAPTARMDDNTIGVHHNGMQVALGSFDDDILCMQRPTLHQDTEESDQVEPRVKRPRISGGNGEDTTLMMRNTPPNGKEGEFVQDAPGEGKAKASMRERSKRSTRRPSKYLEYTPPSVNRPRSEKAGPLHPKRYVWILHPDHPNETVALGQTGSHWKSNKTKYVPNVSGVLWEYGMQQVTVEHVYPQWAHVLPLYRDQQREGIQNMGDVLKGKYAEDSTILWRTTYLNYVQVAKN